LATSKPARLERTNLTVVGIIKMNSNTPELAVIVITLNEEKQLPNLLQDLRNQSWQNFEVIHVDSNSDDDTVAVSERWADQFSDYQIIEMPERGVSLGRNTGAKAARAQRLLFLDADTRLKTDFIKKSIFDIARRNLDVGIVCMDSQGLPWHHSLGSRLFNLGIHLTSSFYPTAVGACLFSTQDMHQKISGFDLRITLCEDCNYVLKAHKQNRESVGIIRPKFNFNYRRLEQDGTLTTGVKYLHANIRRFFCGELYNNEIDYPFGHYK
jgi:glycosyltransferase involved in cell wall biosynthesis